MTHRAEGRNVVAPCLQPHKAINCFHEGIGCVNKEEDNYAHDNPNGPLSRCSVQIGYNNDVEYRGKTFHIQTEDRGEEAAEIETQIFHAGAILDTSIISYEKALDGETDVDKRIAKVRAMMGANHKSLYRKLTKGEYDEMVGLTPLADGEAVDAPDPEEFAPSQDRVPQQAVALEEGNLDPSELAALGGGVEHVDLGSLKDKLKEGLGDSHSSDVEEVAPTMVARPEDLAAAVSRDQKGRPPSGAFRLPTYADTGAEAYQGLEPLKEDLSMVGLVEQFLAG